MKLQIIPLTRIIPAVLDSFRVMSECKAVYYLTKDMENI